MDASRPTSEPGVGGNQPTLERRRDDFSVHEPEEPELDLIYPHASVKEKELANEVYLPGESDIREIANIPSVNYEPPTQPTAFNFSQFQSAEDNQPTIHPSR